MTLVVALLADNGTGLELVSHSTNPALVRATANRLLYDTPLPENPISRSLQLGRRHALKQIADGADRPQLAVVP